MALTKCKECGNEISTEAKTCPKCGAPAPKKTGILTWIFAGILGIVVFNVVLNSGTNSSNSTQSAARPAPTVDKSPIKQAERKKFIEKLITQGLIQKVDTMGGNLPKIYVRPAFYNLDLDTKQNFASVVYAYYFDGSNFTDTVVLRDSRNGQDVGSYNPNAGGLTMK